MRKNPHVDFLTPCETAIFRCLGQAKRGGRTVHWRTAYELSMRTQFAIPTIEKALRKLRRYGLVASRKRDWGFEANVLEFGPCSGVNPFDYKAREEAYRFTGVEPLHLRLKRLLGKARAKELMGNYWGYTPTVVGSSPAFGVILLIISYLQVEYRRCFLRFL